MILAMIGLIFSVPLIIVIVLFIKSSGGPLFFKHNRIGLNGKKIRIIKFRTMDVDAENKLNSILEAKPYLREEWEATFKLTNDPRVTTVGKFLRKKKLDEIPQFFNILVGDMSFVGPRPLTQNEFSTKFNSLDDIRVYQSAVPGLTGAWQVANSVDYDTRIDLELNYARNVNILTDLKIIVKTIWKVIL